MAAFVVGTAVEAQYEDIWYPATIRKAREDSTYDIIWTDGGEKSKRWPAEQIRAAAVGTEDPTAEFPVGSYITAEGLSEPSQVNGQKGRIVQHRLSCDGTNRVVVDFEEPIGHVALGLTNISPVHKVKAAPLPLDAVQVVEPTSKKISSPMSSDLPGREESTRTAFSCPRQETTRTARSTCNGPLYTEKAEINAACAALPKVHGVTEYRGARWNHNGQVEKLGVKFHKLDEGLQLMSVSDDGAAIRCFDRAAIGMILTHVDGAPVDCVEDVQREMGKKEYFRWRMVPSSVPIAVANPSQDQIFETAKVVEYGEVEGTTLFKVQVTRQRGAGDFGTPPVSSVSHRYSDFVGLRTALSQAGCHAGQAFPEKTVLKCSGDGLRRRAEQLTAWLSAVLVQCHKQRSENAAPLAEVNRFLGASPAPATAA